jgi:fibronectin type 3 domain-containing protein
VDASGNESHPSADVTVVSEQTTRKPKSPVAVQAVIPGSDLVRLTWDNPSLADAARVAGFNVYRRVADTGEFRKVTPQPTFYKMYYDDIRNPGLAGKYEYVVTAVDAFGNESVPSAPARAMAPVTR